MVSANISAERKKLRHRQCVATELMKSKANKKETSDAGWLRRLVRPLPCPFCGSKPYDDKDAVARRIMCETNMCAMNSIMVTIEQWNKRPNESKLSHGGGES